MKRHWLTLFWVFLLVFSQMGGSAAGSMLPPNSPELPFINPDDLRRTDPLIRTESRLDTGSLSAAVDDSGGVWVWGVLPGLDDAGAPRKLTGLPLIAQIAVADSYLVALAQDETVWFYGEDSWGSLGDTSNTTYLTPVQVQGLAGVKEVAAKPWYFLALRSDGTVWQSRGSSQVISGLSGITQIAAGYDINLALDSSGRVWAWGGNELGQLGADGGPTAIPRVVPGLTDVVSIGAGDFHGLAVRSDGTVWGWGYNRGPQLGGEPREMVTPARPIPGLTHVAKVTGGREFTVALLQNGTVWVLGSGRLGALGTGTPDVAAEPVQVPGVTDAVDVAAQGHTVMALLGNGNVMVWGFSGFGQVGGLLGEAFAPVAVLQGRPWIAGAAIQSQVVPRVRLVMPTVVPDQGATFSVPIVVENGGALSGLAFSLEARGLELVDAQPGNFFAVVAPNTNSGTTYGTRYDFAGAGRAISSATSGTLATLTFRRTGQSEAEIKLYPLGTVSAITDGLESCLFTLESARLTGVVESGTGSVNGTILLEGRQSGAGVRLTVSGRPDLTAVTDDQGRFLLSGVPVGTVGIIARQPGYLSRRIELRIQEGRTSVAPATTLTAGDIDGDERVHLSDLALLARSLGKQTDDQGFHALADLNGDGQVNIVDQQIMLGNFGQASGLPPIVAAARLGDLTGQLPSGSFQAGAPPTQPGIITPALLEVEAPAKGSVWDSFAVTATVTNQSRSAREFNLYLDLPVDLSILDGAKAMRSTGLVSAGGTATVTWSLSTLVTGTKSLVVTASSTGSEPISQKVQVQIGE